MAATQIVSDAASRGAVVARPLAGQVVGSNPTGLSADRSSEGKAGVQPAEATGSGRTTPADKARALIAREIEAGRITPGHHQIPLMIQTIAKLESAQRADDAVRDGRGDLTPEVAIERAVAESQSSQRKAA